MSLSRSALSDILLVAVTLIAAISWIFSKEAILLMPPILFMAVRFLLAAFCLLLFSAPYLKRLTFPLLRRSLLVGTFFGFAMTSWVMGLATGETMGEGAFLTSLGVILVPVVARIVFKEITPLATWMALPVAILGLVLLSSQHGFRISTAQSYYLVAASLFACFYALNTRATNAEVQQHPVHPLAMTTILMFMASLVTGAASLAFESQHWSKIDISSILVVWVLASAIIGTALRFLMQTYAQSLTQSTNGAVILVIEPIWVVLFSAFWFAERLSLLQLIGCSFILAALLVNRWNVITTGIKKWKR